MLDILITALFIWYVVLPLCAFALIGALLAYLGVVRLLGCGKETYEERQENDLLDQERRQAAWNRIASKAKAPVEQ